ncbi:peptide deformylase [Cytophagaceae bacterium YF14B1]|uniref:Peptide deformylase n=1 Tax=Xanthocytophaga flava TaxID=3048013 RepID=A0AAE3QWM8_9BACT|nr:peptide deformylase [Xanthocytophaga flavus]MDJ1484768.1 peptide deformylase [Xanthocytophaga flavus]
MIYPITAYGDPVLKKVAQPIEKGTDIKKLVDDMYETMYNASGVGLAAPQIGMSVRIFVTDGSPMDEEDEVLQKFKKVFVNPTILEETGEEWAFEEGCLSIPGIRADVNRPPKVKIHYFDENWNEYTEEYEGIPARIIQHEYDHLQGVLFVDKVSAMKKRLIQSKLTDISKGKARADYRLRFAK